MGELANRIRAKYPGAYDALDDATLESKIVAKYPGTYDHLVGGSRVAENSLAADPMNMTAQERKATELARRKFVSDTAATGTRVKESVKNIVRDTMPYVRPILEGGGATVGGVLGAGGGGLAGVSGGPAAPGTVPYGAIAGGTAGAGLGYAAGAKLSDLIESAVGGNSRVQPQTVAGQLDQSLRDIATGATYEMGGQAAVPAIRAVAKGAGAVAKPALAKLAGTGKPVVDEALKGSQPFTDAMRGKISGDDIVDNARTALNDIKDARLMAYQEKLQTVKGNNQVIDMTPIRDKLNDLMQQYNVKQDPATRILNTSRIAMGKKGIGDIEDIIQKVQSWGNQTGDETAVGLDTLKRQLDDFYSDSSQARQFVQSLKKTVHDTITSEVPAYGEMTKGYADASRLIKDVEADFSLRKNGMSGRITADKTLRRLMSAMRDNYEMRADLLKVMGDQGGQDLTAQIAGYTSNQVMPRGLAGVSSGIPTAAALSYLNPKLLPLVTMASPRIQGEFLRMVGKGISGSRAAQPATSAAVRQTAIAVDDTQNGGSQ